MDLCTLVQLVTKVTLCTLLEDTFILSLFKRIYFIE